jgi:hypothetical protein
MFILIIEFILPYLIIIFVISFMLHEGNNHHEGILPKYNNPQDDFFTTDTWVCFFNGIAISWSKSLYKKFIDKMVR